MGGEEVLVSGFVVFSAWVGSLGVVLRPPPLPPPLPFTSTLRMLKLRR